MKNLAFKSAIFLAALACVLLLHHDFLRLGFQFDDLFFMSAKRGEPYFTQVQGLQEWLHIWSPYRGWLYRPVFLTYWAVLHQLHLDLPTVMHFIGLMFHAGVISAWGWLVYRVSRSATFALLAAGAFMLWPGYLEAVSWIAANSVVLAVLLVLASYHAWLSWRESNQTIWYILALMSFFLGCCSKNDVALAAFVLPALDLSSAKRAKWHSYLPFVVVTLMFVVFEKVASTEFAKHDHAYAFKVDVAQRLLCVGQFISKQIDGVWPFHPLDPSSLFLIPLFAGSWLLLKNQTWISAERSKQLVTLSATLGAVSNIALPVAGGVFVLYGAISGAGNRFFYFASMPISLLVVSLSILAVRELWMSRHNLSSPQAIAGLAIAGTLPFSVLKQPIPSISFGYDPATEGIAFMTLCAVCYVGYRCQMADARLALSMPIVILMRAMVVYSDTEFHPAWWMVAAGCICGLMWRRNFITGVLFGFIFWQEPLLSVLVLAVLKLSTINLKQAEKVHPRVAIEL